MLCVLCCVCCVVSVLRLCAACCELYAVLRETLCTVAAVLYAAWLLCGLLYCVAAVAAECALLSVAAARAVCVLWMLCGCCAE